MKQDTDTRTHVVGTVEPRHRTPPLNDTTAEFAEEKVLPSTTAPASPPPTHQLDCQNLPEPTLQVDGVEFLYDDDNTEEDGQHAPLRCNVPALKNTVPDETAGPSAVVVTLPLHKPTSQDSERMDDVDIQAGTPQRTRRLSIRTNI